MNRTPEWDEATTFLHAVASGDMARVQDMVAAGVSIETPNPSEGDTPLLMAARLGVLPMVSYLIGRGANLHARNRFGQTVLHFIAAQPAALDHLGNLVSLGVELEARDVWGGTPILTAADAATGAVIRKLLDLGADPFARDKDGGNLVFRLVHSFHSFPERPERRSIREEHLALLRDLVALGVDPRAGAMFGRDAVTEAAERGLTEVLYALSSIGVDTWRPDARGLTPLQAAALANRRRAARAIEADAPADFFSQVALDDLSAVRKRLDREPELSRGLLKGEGGPDCALALAVGNASASMARLLLSHGADANGPSSRWSSILHAAVSRGLEVSLIRLLLDKGAAVDSGDGDGNTPLNLAARRGDIEVAELLLDRGADVNSTTERGYTPLMFAKDEAIRALLIGRGGRE